MWMSACLHVTILPKIAAFVCLRAGGTGRALALLPLREMVAGGKMRLTFWRLSPTFSSVRLGARG
jgi:hypothetical protein